MATQLNARFHGRVTGTAAFGLFVSLDETGAEGLIPVSTLGDDLFTLDERHHALVGQRTGETFGLGDTVKVELLEADPVQGTLRFGLIEHERGHGAELARAAWRKGGGRGRGGRPPPRHRRR
jgi:ribonuclease R